MGNIRKILGDNIRRLRNLRGWTQVYLADTLGINASFLTMIESGQRGMSLDMIEKMSECFGVDAASLFIDRTKSPKDDNSLLKNSELENLKLRLNSQITQVIESNIDELKI